MFSVCTPAGGQGFSDETFVEYDLDKEDEAWLEEFNAGQPRIAPSKLETMLWVLVCVWVFRGMHSFLHCSTNLYTHLLQCTYQPTGNQKRQLH